MDEMGVDWLAVLQTGVTETMRLAREGSVQAAMFLVDRALEELEDGAALGSDSSKTVETSAFPYPTDIWTHLRERGWKSISGLCCCASCEQTLVFAKLNDQGVPTWCGCMHCRHFWTWSSGQWARVEEDD